MLDQIDRAIINTLSDGQFHSGEAIGVSVGVTRAAVWKHIKHLETLGCEIVSISRQGYKLKTPIELLNAEKIQVSLEPPVQQLIPSITILDTVDSTNDYLRRQTSYNTTDYAAAVLAEQQTHGRGRRGRTWSSSFGSNIYLSLRWSFECAPTDLSGLGLVIGLAVRKAIAQSGYCDVQVKWPNDLLHAGRKLAGVLVEIAGEANTATQVIIGIGVNVQAPISNIGQSATGLGDMSPQSVQRNVLVARLLNQLTAYLLQFQQFGLAPMQQEWLEHDAFYQQKVKVIESQGEVVGRHSGIDLQGRLLLEVGGGKQAFSVGDVSLRQLSE